MFREVIARIPDLDATERRELLREVLRRSLACHRDEDQQLRRAIETDRGTPDSPQALTTRRPVSRRAVAEAEEVADLLRRILQPEDPQELRAAVETYCDGAVAYFTRVDHAFEDAGAGSEQGLSFDAFTVRIGEVLAFADGVFEEGERARQIAEGHPEGA